MLFYYNFDKCYWKRSSYILIMLYFGLFNKTQNNPRSHTKSQKGGTRLSHIFPVLHLFPRCQQTYYDRLGPGYP